MFLREAWGKLQGNRGKSSQKAKHTEQASLKSKKTGRTPEKEGSSHCLLRLTGSAQAGKKCSTADLPLHRSGGWKPELGGPAWRLC